MTRISDSDAVLDPSRVLPQHQAALTLVAGRLSDPATTTLSWLDLACGRGQIISSLEITLSERARGKIEFTGIDIDNEYTKQVDRAAAKLKLRSATTLVSDLEHFYKMLPDDQQFDLITMTNTVHEIAPVVLPGILLDAISRLTPSGTLFLYDMDRLAPPELGAVTWNRDEMQRLLRSLLSGLGVTEYDPEVTCWPHRSCNGWNVQLDRQHLQVTGPDIADRRKDALARTSAEMVSILQFKFQTSADALDSLVKYGPATAAEKDEENRLLRDHYALFRALRAAGSPEGSS